ncbi:hypothetical protein PROFUN_06240 [Planoprotostelium fungivorum]|uniref:F-box domain-containing protein n=1 Tax=Planoprotostelium fungivorum TaxID=1890364 RepID=A0A2P6NE42_9EUKA|nr:hypothetical protein PROFUN_06240 [Planoprotostelium fungivorum]
MASFFHLPFEMLIAIAELLCTEDEEKNHYPSLFHLIQVDHYVYHSLQEYYLRAVYERVTLSSVSPVWTKLMTYPHHQKYIVQVQLNARDDISAECLACLSSLDNLRRVSLNVTSSRFCGLTEVLQSLHGRKLVQIEMNLDHLARKLTEEERTALRHLLTPSIKSVRYSEWKDRSELIRAEMGCFDMFSNLCQLLSDCSSLEELSIGKVFDDYSYELGDQFPHLKKIKMDNGCVLSHFMRPLSDGRMRPIHKLRVHWYSEPRDIPFSSLETLRHVNLGWCVRSVPMILHDPPPRLSSLRCRLTDISSVHQFDRLMRNDTLHRLDLLLDNPPPIHNRSRSSIETTAIDLRAGLMLHTEWMHLCAHLGHVSMTWEVEDEGEGNLEDRSSVTYNIRFNMSEKKMTYETHHQKRARRIVEVFWGLKIQDPHVPPAILIL